MRKIYIVYYVDNVGETWDIIDIFDSKDKALDCINHYENRYHWFVDIDEYEVK